MNNNSLFVLFDYVAMNGVFMLCFFNLIVRMESDVFLLKEKSTLFNYQKGKWHSNPTYFIYALEFF